MAFEYILNKWHEGAESLLAPYSEQKRKKKQSVDKFYSNKDNLVIKMKTETIYLKNVLYDPFLEHIRVN